MPFICFQSFISMKMRKYFCSNHIFVFLQRKGLSCVQARTLFGGGARQIPMPQKFGFRKSLIRTATSSQILEYCSGVRVF